jgi:RimJ/RimL family protein N-acetyltransferase
METSENRGQLVHTESAQRKHALPIETPHLTLRAFRDKDVDPLFAIQGDHEAMRYTYTAPSRQACAHWLRTFAALEATLGFAPWTVVLRTEAQVIGWGGLSIDPFNPGWGIEVSYFFDPAYWDQRAHSNRNIRFRSKVYIFQYDTAKEISQQTSNCSMVIGSLTH